MHLHNLLKILQNIKYALIVTFYHWVDGKHLLKCIDWGIRCYWYVQTKYMICVGIEFFNKVCRKNNHRLILVFTKEL